MNVLRYLRFAVVGAAAATTHFCVAVAVVSFIAWPPQAANVVGYLAALMVSYIGQSRWTFAHSGEGTLRFAKFTATSFSAFVLNAALYAALLRWTRLDYRIALIAVLLAVAVLTFLTLSSWVFVTKRQRAA